MSITLAVGSTAVELSPDLYWSDEFSWSPVTQSTERSITGALVVQVAAMTGGRPITLGPEDDGSAWMPRSAVEQLRNWADGAGTVMTLTLRGQVRDVIFRHHDGPAIEARPIAHFADANATDPYLCTLRLTEITEI